jgi:hypothetical protein
MTESTPLLAALGDALEASAAADLASSRARLPRRRSRRLVALVAVAAAAVVSGASFAAVELTSNEEVAASLPAGSLWLAGTEPSCTTVTQDVEYHCVLGKAPANAISDWKGTVEPTVDATKHVNGGCRSLASDGREWECYLGQAAVDQQIIGAGFLGQEVTGPGVG